MNYLAEMLRDCSKNRSSSFTEISFPIIQQIENKIKNKNFNLRKKMKQRLIDRQRITKTDEKRDQISNQSKKDNSNPKCEKEIINYIEAYDDQKNYQTKGTIVQLEEVKLDDKQTQNTFLICFLMRKRKSIFKIQEVRRKLRSKENLKRMSLKECDCCERVGKHKCLHKFCQGKCEKLRKSEKYDSVAAAQEFEQEFEAIELAQEVIEQKVKMQDLSLNVVRIIQKEEEAISIPKIDITEKEDEMKEEHQQEILNERDRISENQSKSEVSESRRNRSSEQSKMKENAQQLIEKKEQQCEPQVKKLQEEEQQQIEDDLVQIQTIQRIPQHKINYIQQIQNKQVADSQIRSLHQRPTLELTQPNQITIIIPLKENPADEQNNVGGKTQENNKIQHLQEEDGNFLDALLCQLENNIEDDMPDSEMRVQ